MNGGSCILVRDPLDVLRAAESGYTNAVCFLTEEVTPAQLEFLAAAMKQRQCTSLTFF